MISLIPALRAAITFSLMPPTGSTFPFRLISPVIASPCLIGRFSAVDSSAVVIAQPALGPSFGVAPSGKCMCRSEVSRISNMALFEGVTSDAAFTALKLCSSES